MPNLTTARPGWRRHIPPLLLLLALATLIAAIARPQRTVAAPQRAANVVMVTDISGSMNATDVDPDRLTRRGRGGQDAERARCRRRSGSGSSRSPTTPSSASRPTTDRAQIKGALDQLVAEGGTAMGDGLERGLLAARTPVPNADGTGVHRLPSVIVLLSDGKNTSGSRDPVSVAREAGQARVPIYAIALGTPSGEVELRDSFGFLQRVQVPPDTETLKEVARLSGGKCLHGDGDRQGQGDLRQPRHAAVLAQREARGHRGLRGRRDRVAARRRRALAAPGSAASI